MTATRGFAPEVSSHDMSDYPGGKEAYEEFERMHPSKTSQQRDIGVKYDSKKPRMGLLPPLATVETAKVLTFGAQKYAPDNWRYVDNAKSRYVDAALRHIFQYMSGEKLDEESRMHHLAHAQCCIAFALEFELEENK